MRSVKSFERVVDLLSRVYRLLLVAYPAGFRREYGEQMLQVFRTSCRQMAWENGPYPLARFGYHALRDLVASARAERVAAIRQQASVSPSYLYVATTLLALVTGYVHLRLDADVLVAVLLLAGTFCCGVACPGGAWRWAVIAGLGIPVALLLGHGTGATAFAHRDADLPLPATLIPTLLGAYVGVAVHHLLARPIGILGLRR